MRTNLRAWICASALLLLGSVAGAAAVRLHWLPCRGSMLSGSVLHDYRYGADFSAGCLRAMDSGFGLVDAADAGMWSAESALGTIAVLLFALAWTSVVVRSAWSRESKGWALLPPLATVVTLVLNIDHVAETLGMFSMILTIAPNLLAVAAFFVIWVKEKPGAVVLLQVALALGASTAVGLVPTLAEYSIMGSFSDANWDAPPGSGYLTVGGVALIGLMLLVLTLLRLSAARVEEAAMATSPGRRDSLRQCV